MPVEAIEFVPGASSLAETSEFAPGLTRRGDADVRRREWFIQRPVGELFGLRPNQLARQGRGDDGSLRCDHRRQAYVEIPEKWFSVRQPGGMREVL